jgi:hypothetical protein
MFHPSLQTCDEVKMSLRVRVECEYPIVSHGSNFPYVNTKLEQDALRSDTALLNSLGDFPQGLQDSPNAKSVIEIQTNRLTAAFCDTHGVTVNSPAQPRWDCAIPAL